VTSLHAPFLAQLPLPPAAVPALTAYLDLLQAWSRRVNLTGAASAEDRVRILVGDVLPLAPWVEPGHLIDVGSGNGSPGLVLALLSPAAEVTLLEPRQRRWAFLLEAARVMGRSDLRVLRARHDGYAGPRARTLTIRGLSLPLRELLPLMEPAGRLLVLGRDVPAEAPFVRENGPADPRLPLTVLRREVA